MGPSLPVAYELLGGVARAVYLLKLEWLVTRLVMLCSVCIEWVLCKGLWVTGEPLAASQGQAKGVEWSCYERQVGPHPLSLMTTLVISPTLQGYLSMGGGGEAERPEEKQRLHSDSGLAGVGVADGGAPEPGQHPLDHLGI